MRISLKNGERIYVNGAVLRVDRKVAIELLNDVTFLLESQVMQVADANTPLRQLYFIVQLLLINPADTCEAISLFRQQVEVMRAVVRNAEIFGGLTAAESLVGDGRPYEALKAIRGLFPVENAIIGELNPDRPNAAA